MLNQQEIEHIIHRYFKKFKKLFNKIEKHFDADDIHEFRVEFKKLRAFLRLLGLEIADAENLDMPRNLKEIYTVNGKIRELQLQILRIDDIVNAKEKLPNYRNILKKEIKKLKRELKFWLKHEQVSEMEEKINVHLPESLKAATIKNFSSFKFSNIMALFTGKFIADESLHRIRKNIKDILYVYKIFEEYRIVNMEELFGDKLKFDHAALVAEELGKFNDLCIALTLLRPEWLSSVKETEKMQLEKISRHWMEEKEILKQQLVEIIVHDYLYKKDESPHDYYSTNKIKQGTGT